ncbi:MAG TPA: YidC/Oxa1 family membrane protein insertase [Candidatus Paceibacterota bacterium]|nr:YidC/Oxa1 family membrane protein insertase [Candidatus Paceibacterota bacterium]
MHYLYTTVVYNPLYNGLVILMNSARFAPWIDAGMVVILFTIIVRLVLFPISKKAARTQVVMKTVEPELAAIKEKYKDDKQAQAIQTMALYKEKKINPFSSILLLFIQLPIIIALYRIFYTTGFSTVHTELLYSWVSIPPAIGTHFLDLIDVTQKSVFLAALAALSQYLQISISVPKAAARPAAGAKLHEDLARNMQAQMKYVFPVMIFFISWNVAGALAIYWITSNLFMIGQELYIRRQIAREKAAK